MLGCILQVVGLYRLVTNQSSSNFFAQEVMA